MVESLVFNPDEETLDQFCERLNAEIDKCVEEISDPVFKAKMWRLMVDVRREQNKLKDPLSRAQVAFNRLMYHIEENYSGRD